MKRERRRPFTLTLHSIAADLAQQPTPQASPLEAYVAETAPLAAAPPGAARKPARPRLTATARWAYAVAVTCAVAWAGAFLAFVSGFGRLGPFDYAPFRDVVVGAMAILPALFMLLFAYALRQGLKLGDDVRTTRRLSEDLVGPLALSASQTGDLMIAMRTEIERASDVAAEAEQRLQGLRDGIAHESRRLSEAAQEAQTGARTLSEALGRERGELYTLTAALEARTLEVTEAVGRQSRLAADVSDLAQAQLTEAQAALAARAADLTAAAADVRDSADAAAEVLARHTEQVGAVGQTVSGRLSRLSDQLSEERDRLSTLADALKGDHDEVAARAETQQARLAETAAEARHAGEAAAAAADQAAGSLRALIGEATEQVRLAAETTASLRGQAADEAVDQLSRLAALAEQQRAATALHGRETAEALSLAAERAQVAASARLSELQQQAHALGASALDRIEQVNEATFAAGQRADQVFDARILAAKRAIDQSATAVEQAGLRAAQRIETGLGAARAALGELDGLLAEVDSRFSSMPEEARQRAEAVRSVVERGVGDLTAAARRAAEETQAIDSAFQERVRRNYDTLSEAVRLMGRVAGAVDAAARTPAVAPAAPSVVPAPVAATPALEPARVHALDLAARARAAPAASAQPRPQAAPMPIAVGDSHPRFADAARTGDAPDAPKLLLRNGAWSDASDNELFAAPSPPSAVPSSATQASAPQSAESAGLRPRLSLSLSALGAPEPAARPAPAAARPAVTLAAQAPTPAPAPATPAVDRASRPPGWSWKDLLSTLPEEPATVRADDDEALADRLLGEIEALGLDVDALLPRTQVEEIAAELQSGSGGSARDSVRRLAPAAVRRLSRRVLTDPVLRRDAGEFVRRYAALVSDAARRDADGFLSAALLGSDAGRAYMMLDAAIGDLAH